MLQTVLTFPVVWHWVLTRLAKARDWTSRVTECTENVEDAFTMCRGFPFGSTRLLSEQWELNTTFCFGEHFIFYFWPNIALKALIVSIHWIRSPMKTRTKIFNAFIALVWKMHFQWVLLQKQEIIKTETNLHLIGIN